MSDQPTEILHGKVPLKERALLEALQQISVWPVPVNFVEAKQTLMEIRSFAREAVRQHAKGD